MNTEHVEYINRCETAFNQFVDGTPDFVNSEENNRQLIAALDRLGLTYDRASHLEIAFRSIKPNTPTTPAPAPAAVPTALQVGLSPDRITAEAERMIRDGEVSNEIVFRMSAKELEHRSHSLAFAKALDLLHERNLSVEPSRGDVNHSFGVATKNHTNLGNEIVKTVDARLAPTVQAQDPYRHSPSAARRSGIINQHEYGVQQKKQPSLAQALALEKKDQKFLDEAATKTARLIRMKAHKGK
jgi:hypothetical protein